jgi:hypothetical protein
LTDDFLKLFVEDRVRILYRLEKFAKYDMDLAGKGVGRGLQDSMPACLRIL